MDIKERVEKLIEKHVMSGNDIDWVILSRLDFITLVFELYGHVKLNGVKIVSDEPVQEGEAQIVDAKGIRDIQLYEKK